MIPDFANSPRRGRRWFAGLVHLMWLWASCAPGPAAPVAERRHGIYHTVRAGENLYRIGKAYDVSHDKLARLNRLRHADQIRVGQKIFVPGATRPLPVEIITPAVTVAETAPAEKIQPEPPAHPYFDSAFIWPLSGTINSAYGPRGSSFHDGIDIAAPEGTPVRAIESGEVIFSDRLRGYGNMVIVRHAQGFVSVYAHNQINLVREGQRVARGEMIARVGSTGRVTGPHLHFEIRRHNAAEDPLRYLPRLCCDAVSDRLTPGG